MGTLVFLQPFFLIATAAVAAPLLIHLIQRRRRKRVAFSTLRFLLATDRRSARRYRLVDLLVMALRMALLALVALALAQPMLRPKGTGTALGIPSVAVVIDDSLSMQAAAGGASLFSKAVEAARRLLSDMPQQGEAFIMLTSGRQARALAAPTSPPSSLLPSLGSLSCSYGGRTLAAAVNEAAAALRQCKNPHKSLVVIGDRHARALDDAGALDRAALEATADSATYIDVSADIAANLGLVEAAAAPPVGLPGMPLRLRAKVFNAGDTPVSATVTLWINGEKSAERTASLPAGGPGEVAFNPVLKQPGLARATIKVEADALGGDDAWYLPLRVLPPVRALIVTPPGTGAAETLYLRMALSPGGTGRAGGAEPVILKETDYDRAGEEPLARYGMIFLFSDARLSEALKSTLDDYVAGGGVLVCYPALALVRQPAAAPAPAWAIGPPIAPGGDETWGIDRYEKEHALFSLLAARAPTLLTDVAITAAVDLGTEAPAGGQVLASLPGGRALLTELESGSGRRFVWAVGCHPDWGDLPLRPIFVPLVFEMLKTAAAGSGQAMPAGTVDKGFTLDLGSPSAAAGLRVETPAGTKVDARAQRGTGRIAFDQAPQPGFYLVESAVRPGAEPVAVAGVNAAGEESDLRRAGDDEMKKFIPAKTELRIVRDGHAAAQRLEYATQGFAFARWLLGLAVAALLAATWLANSLIRVERDENMGLGSGAPPSGGIAIPAKAGTPELFGKEERDVA